jgi:glycosyltransferase involved in cell wall biosynthesis
MVSSERMPGSSQRLPERVLLLSHAFPPLGRAEAFLSAKRMGCVPGFVVDVVCSNPPPGWGPYDASLDAYVAERFGHVVRVGRSRTWDVVRFGRAAELVRPPDEFRLLNGPARRAAAVLLRTRSYAAIVTWSQMHSIHLVGRALRRRFRLPWLAHLSDPWAANPFVTRSRLELRLNERLERKVFESADRLLFTSLESVDLSLAGYPPSLRAKSRVLPHAYDPQLYPSREKEERRDDVIVLRYLGAFYGPRSPFPLVRALTTLRKLDPTLLRRLRVEIVGTVETGMLDTPEAKALPAGTLTLRPPVDYVRSLELMTTADGLVVVDAPAEGSPFLPSKLVDYVGAGRPIVALTPPGAAAELTRRLGGPVANPREPAACAEALRQLVRLAAAQRSEPFGSPEIRRELAVDTVGPQMAALIREVLPAPAASHSASAP